jgi:hypothetical protein
MGVTGVSYEKRSLSPRATGKIDVTRDRCCGVRRSVPFSSLSPEATARVVTTYARAFALASALICLSVAPTPPAVGAAPAQSPLPPLAKAILPLGTPLRILPNRAAPTGFSAPSATAAGCLRQVAAATHPT